MSRLLSLARRHVLAFAAIFLLTASSAWAVVDRVASRAARDKQRLFACVAGSFRSST